MKAVAITANPEPRSLTEAMGNAFLDGAAEAGADTDLIDLYAEGFNPVYSMEDRLHYLDQGPLPADVAAMQNRIADADVLAFVFPIYWFSLPALMKGFFDRVLCRRFAYHADGTPGALAGKKVRLIMLCGGEEARFRSDGVDAAIDTQLVQRTLNGYCGVDDIEKVYIDRLTSGDDDPQVREEIKHRLIRVTLMGRKLAVEGGASKVGERA
ncbi:NAD(P)H dehydrogenase (quinone) [Bifidobacterium actinocoloniiforme DSM 22766]|uniref:NAD(P)H dehydrogenase (Quinone) n=1 Tax=Bifidobacterium actinocoloniiforme DSM 22766 TaxID=1437605 RepID=A0A086Z009_9BIFI|nr:NAD(P)H-dependent oxidoreductase [Bifidobacterium actinocoloniiforme]AKV55128.1 NAD(P)H dehydrogenase [Bifidobacterium actinocoloniiforme DSM 22766]KFI39859.1 NAD(P)H dehydrogenase (quinone) [Bifidobacterium actinocoloniiforme DSM 22766]